MARPRSAAARATAAARGAERGADGAGGAAGATGSAPARLLGLRVGSALALVARIEEGLSYRAFERLQRAMQLSAADLAELIRVKPRTLARRREEGRFQPDESERVLRASRLYSASLALFEGDAASARRWLATPNSALGGHTPLALARTEVGAREVERLLDRLEHGVFS